VTAAPATSDTDLACFSYLAHTKILCVGAYPPANHGAEVHQTIVSLAADGPLAAVTAARQGLRTTLVANPVADDPAGHHVRRMLAADTVHYRTRGPAPSATPQMTVVADNAGTRTWFADLSYASLEHTDLSPLSRARLAYIDCYRILTKHAARAIQTAAGAGVPLLLNLGNDPLDPAIQDAAHHADIWAVQTGLPEEQAHRAEAQTAELLRSLRPHTAVVTLGSRGAIAATRSALHHVAARTVPLVHTHGAGAAFSGGLAAAHLRGDSLKAALQYACETGTTHCATPHPGSTPTCPRPPVPAPLAHTEGNPL